MNNTFGVEFENQILIYTTKYDAIMVSEKIKKGINRFGWEKDELQPCLAKTEKENYTGVIVG